MSQHYTYLLVDLGCLIFPLLFSFHPRLNFYRQWKYFLLPCLLVASFFLAWDALYTHLGVWSFDSRYVLGLFVLGMPVEEYLFFICIPFACLFSYHAFTTLFRFSDSHRLITSAYAILAILLLIAGAVNITRLYTGVTFLLLSVLLFFCLWKHVKFLPAFLATFSFVLIPFLISNGILTGSFLARVVVRYNAAENLGVRLLTIPIEDVFYAMLLLLLNVYGFEWQRRKLLQNPYRH